MGELGNKYVNVVKLTGWSESNVKFRAFRARQALNAILEKKYERL